MRQVTEEQIMFLGTSLLSSAFTMDTTDEMTVTGHGWRRDDKIRVSSATTLPAGLSANTDYYVVEVVDANTVKIATTLSGTAITTTDAGTGTHTAVLKSKVILVEDFRHLSLSWHTANSANLTTKVQGSNQEDVNFENAASSTNRWEYIQVVNKEDGSTIDGDTGIAPTSAGTDDNFNFAINVDGLMWVSLDVTAWVAGTVDARIKLFND